MTELTAIGRTDNRWRDAVQRVLNRVISGGEHRRLGKDIWVQSRGKDPVDKHDLNKIIL